MPWTVSLLVLVRSKAQPSGNRNANNAIVKHWIATVMAIVGPPSNRQINPARPASNKAWTIWAMRVNGTAEPAITGVIWYSAPIMPIANTPSVPACVRASACGIQGLLRDEIPATNMMQPATRTPMGMVRKKLAGMDSCGACSRLRPPVFKKTSGSVPRRYHLPVQTPASPAPALQG